MGPRPNRAEQRDARQGRPIKRKSYTVTRVPVQNPNRFVGSIDAAVTNRDPNPYVGNMNAAQAAARAQREAEILANAERYATEMAYKSNRFSFAKKATAQASAKYLYPREIAAASNYGVSAESVRSTVRAMSAVKDRYRRAGLYYGDQSPSYDPLLKDAHAVQYATSAEEQAAAVQRLSDNTVAAQNARIAKVTAAATKAQAALKAKTRDIQKLMAMPGVDAQTKSYLQAIYALAKDPNSVASNPDGVVQAERALRRIRDGVRESNSGGFTGGLKRAFGSFTRVVGTPIEEFTMQPYYAASLARDEGLGFWGQIGTGLSAMPGYGFLAGGKSADIRSRVNSPEKRAVEGLRSFGENVTGGSSWWNSGIADAVFQVAGDPTTYASAGLSKFATPGRLLGDDALRAVARESGENALRVGLSNPAKLVERLVARAGSEEGAALVRQSIGEAAARARTNFLENTRRGKNLTAALTEVVTGPKGLDAAALRRAIPGLDERAALEIASATSREAATEAIKKAFVTGEFNPTISLRRQLTGTYARKGGVGLGAAPVRATEGVFDVVGMARKVVRGDAVRSTGRATTTLAAEYNTLRAGLARAGMRLDDAFKVVGEEVIGLPIEDRLGRVWDQLEGNAGLQDLFERGLKRAEDDALAVLGIANPTLKELDKVGEAIEPFLKQMEVLGALATGEFGEAAAKQVTSEAKFGLGRTVAKDQSLMKQALGNTTLVPVPETQLKRAEELRYLDARVRTKVTNPEAQEVLLRELDRIASQKGRKGLNLFDRRLETLLRDGTVDELGRLAKTQSELVGATEGALDHVGLGRRLLNQPVKLVNSLLEPVAPAKVAFLGYENTPLAIANRTEGVDRWMTALGLDDFTRQMFRESVQRVEAEDDLFAVVDSALAVKAARHGLPEGMLQAKFKEAREAVKAGERINIEAILEDGTVQVDDAVYTLAQRGEVVLLPDPEEVQRFIREESSLIGDRIRVGLSKVADAPLGGIKSPITGEDLTSRTVARGIHRKWKLLTVVPGTELAAFGAVAGAVTTDGDLGDKAKGAAFGASIGLLSPLRYIMRVPGIEEGARKWLANGFNPEAWKPQLSKFATQSGLDRPFRPFNAVRAGDPIGIRAQSLLETVANEWEVLEPAANPVAKLFRKDRRFLDAYGRIINYQAHPESDAVAELFLRHAAGEVTDAERLDEYMRFMDTPGGELWLRRFKGGAGGPKNADEAFERMSEFFGRYFADVDVARARLDAARSFAKDGVKRDVPKEVIKKAQRAGTLPEAVHAERTFVMPKNIKEVALMRDRLTSKFAFEGPTTALNRAPMAKAIYKDEYLRLRSTGVAEDRAQEIAEQLAVEKTNRVMFRIDDESRFAAKADPYFPFQQPREEMLKVWAPLIAQNPVRAAQATRLGALAFNNGKDKGIFQKDQYGDWRMTVPGSAALSKALFGSSSAFNFRLSDLLFFGQGAYGVNIIPSPGGPFWGVASRMAINAWPEAAFENLPDYAKEWLFPYGASGRIFRPEVSRMWQAWTGEPAPFEFANRQEQENALNKHRIEVFLQLIWQHGQKTGDWSYRPSDEEVDEAVSASLKAWALIGAFFPAGPGFMRPDQESIDAIKDRYVGMDGQFDYFGFIGDYPQYEPWMVGKTSTVDNSFEAWRRTQDERQYDTLTHKRTTKDFSKWRAELAEREAESKAYREKGDIRFLPDNVQQQAYAAWDEKYPELAARTSSNYQRDVELMRIEGTLIGASKDAALDIWRKRYDVSFANYQRLLGDLRQGELRASVDPWEVARPAEMVFNEVQKELNRTVYKAGRNGDGFEQQFSAEQGIVSRLPVAEQVKYWQWRLNHMDYDATDDPAKVLDRYYTIKGLASDLFKSAPLTYARNVKPKKELPKWAAEAQAKSENYRAEISDISRQIADIGKQLNTAYETKNWSTYWALKKKRDALYDMKEALQNQWYQSIPDIQRLADEVKATSILTARGRTDLLTMMRKYRSDYGFFIPTDQQASYLAMNSDTRAAYIDDLVNGLTGQKFNRYGGVSGLKFEYLTQFQKDLLKANLSREDYEYLESGGGQEEKGSGGKGSGGFYRGDGSAHDELTYAYTMFKRYNMRGNTPEPAAYKEYLALPNDAVLRSAFLKQHPEVAEYIKLGPMANMPPVLQMIVADIMIRNGKWEGEPREMTEITEIAFAREQLKRWNLRGDRERPATYQTWLDMPTGPEKAAYLKAHPEIGEWLQLGPMANMPEAFREVVRDIMMRYGEWTNEQDALGMVIQGYYATPSYGRDAYLEQHPELVEYWKAIRSPEEQAMFDLSDRYFSIQDPMAKRSFLQVHPELNEWFLQKRQARYENFLNRVAVYMGQSPELFEKYLQRQEDILSELLHKFSEAPLIRERTLAPTLRDNTKKDRRAA